MSNATMSQATKGRIKHDPATIEQAVKRYLEKGESVDVLSKYYKAAKPTVYVWIKNHKARLIEKHKQSDMTPKNIERADRQTLELQNESLKDELRKTRDKLVSLMIKHGEL